jgi:hypothetical protein
MKLENSSKHTLPEQETRQASGVTTPDLVANEKNLDIGRQSNEDVQVEKTEASPVSTEEYPKGSHLVPILAAVIFAVFLVALDMVSPFCVVSPETDQFLDHCWYCHSQNHR